jgi:DNA modification methylase
MARGGVSDLKWTPVKIRLGQVKPWTNNPRMSTKAQAERLIQSERELGQVQTIAIGQFDADGFAPLYDGHQRYSAWLTVKGAEYELTALQSNRDLTEDERRKMAILLHTATGGWDWNQMAGWQVGELKDWGLISQDNIKGWQTDITNVKELLAAENETTDAEPQIERADELQEKWQVKTGDLWQIGNHRLLCGDSAKREDVERLLNGNNADLTVTSPPYFNMREYSFFETYEDYLLFVKNVIIEILNIANKKSFALMWNVSTDISHGKDIPADTSIIAQSLGFRFCGDVCWVKSGSSSSSMRSNHIITDQHYYPLLKHEPIKIFSFGKYPSFDKKDTEYVNNILGDVWEITQVLGSEQKKVGHNAPFPLELANRCVLSMSKSGAIAYEPFGGSGTTMMVCENQNRINFTMDYEPKYCSVILERMSQAFPHLEIKRL